ncbi:HAD superfamily, subfamily IIIB (Acid phosphatase) [Microlunatus sagamiharensis]|uniref:HAD superfamily, subfamily IIIB (Acid phosphatase) n=1 Tax=Microlunatus sagamiharensis TaxID=546874 RepID=A0A1H2N2E7_9ACTN|nr:HAD family acid phosphatase [Microlunatus sagamiharensis]SDU99341.1 HAD superfamily, subfamily IIIB (Acid phosphatase) [Microlunatus sagamiharensis]
MPRPRPSVLVAGLATALLGALVAPPAGAQPVAPSTSSTTVDVAARSSAAKATLAPRTHFTMKPDGSSGRTQGGEGIPNVDSVKKTIATYYGDPGTGIASKTTSPYISEMRSIVRAQDASLQKRYDQAKRRHEKPALVFDTDDTTLFTYDMEVSAMHFTFDPAIQQQWIDDQRFAATPAMVDYVNRAAKIGYRIIGLTGRSASQEELTLANLRKVGYTAFTADDFYTKWQGTKPSYIRCVDVKACTTVEYKAGTRRYLERKKGLTIVANYGDQWSDLQGGYADHTVKLPNPTYYLPSANLPGVKEKKLAPRTHFTMAPDGSSGQYVGGEGIPNVDSVKKTIAVYYGDPGIGIASKTRSPYISELTKIADQQRRALKARYRAAVARGEKPALVFDSDDTTLFTYDMEVHDMHFTFDPVLQDEWVQDQRFPATPAMVSYVKAAQKAGFTIFGLTGRNDGQKAATIANLAKVGYPADAFVADRFFTKPKSGQPYPAWVSGCVGGSTCTTIEYKSKTRAHIEDDLGYTVVATFGDQYSDLLGGYADRAVKLPNPTYYLP